MSAPFRDALQALPTVATHPLALVAYLVTVAAGFLLRWRAQRLRLLLTNIQKLPDGDRLKALRAELGPVRVPPKLTAEQWIRSRIHLYYFGTIVLISIVAITIAAFAFAAKAPTEADLKVVGVSIDDQRQDAFPKLEIKVRNVGGKVAFLKSANLEVARIDNLESPEHRIETHVDLSWEYSASLRLFGAPYVVAVPLAQSVKGDEVDRFAITLAYDERKTESDVQRMAMVLAARAAAEGKDEVDMDTIMKSLDSVPTEELLGLMFEKERVFSLVELRIKVVYNESNKSVLSESLMFVMPRMNCFLMATSIRKPNANEIIEENRKKLAEIRRLFHGKRSPALEKLFASL